MRWDSTNIIAGKVPPRTPTSLTEIARAQKRTFEKPWLLEGLAMVMLNEDEVSEAEIKTIRRDCKHLA